MASNIVYFDGVCGMCNATVDFIMKKDKKNKFLFTPLQGETAKKNLGKNTVEQLDTVYFQKGEKIYHKSSAVIQICWLLGGIYRVMIIGWIIPPFIRNLLYDFIARNRYKWFGKKEECRLPTPQERKKFLP